MNVFRVLLPACFMFQSVSHPYLHIVWLSLCSLMVFSMFSMALPSITFPELSFTEKMNDERNPFLFVWVFTV